MAVTLDPILNAAQANQERKPLCRILSLENVDPIPFDGEYLNTATPNEQNPTAGVHSSGRLFVAFAVDSGVTDTVRYGYTDTERTFFTYVDFVLALGRVAGEVAAVDLADGFVGLVWEETSGGTRSIKYRIITVDGAEVDPPVTGTILTNPTADFFTGPTVTKLSDDSYLMAYGLMDGADYNLYFRTSADFATWSAAAEVDLSALDSEMRKANPHLLAFSTGEIWLLFDYVDDIGPNGEELTNIYYVSTSNIFTTNTAAAALTSYTEYGNRAEHPVTAQSITGQVYLAFDRVVSSLRMDKDSTGWCYSGASPISNMHIDVARQKLYAVSSRMSAGDKVLFCVVKIDLETWTIDDCWSTSTVPAFPDYLGNTSGVFWDACKGAGEYVAVSHANGVVSVLNGETDTITTYAFFDFSAYGIAKNINWTIPSGAGSYSLAKVQIDLDNKKMYIALARSYYYRLSIIVGWIDLDAVGPTYNFTTVVSATYPGSVLNQGRVFGFLSGYGWMEVNTEAGLIIISMEGVASSWSGMLQIFDLTTGGLWKEYDVNLNPTFPYRGLRRGVYNDGLIVGDFTYEPLYGNADYRGLCIIDTATDVVTYNRPPFASVNEYRFGDICLTDDDEYVIASNGYGIVLFDGTTWTVYDNDALPGLTPTGEEVFAGPVAYNPTTSMIIAGHGIGVYPSGWSGLVMFSRDGYIRQANYIVGTIGTPWTWSAVAPLVRGYTDYEAAITFDPDDSSLYAFWTSLLATEMSIKWDKALAEFDATSYLLRGTPVERFSTIDPVTGLWDAGLSFSCSHGHLFDTSNGLSLFRSYLAMGRKVKVQFGERVGATDYWEPARIFTVSSDAEVDYSRGDYPTVRVECETPRRRWSQIHIVASDYYQTTPELIIADLLETYASIDPVDISLGTWTNSATVEYQFVDVMLADAIDMLAIHFGYSIRDGANGIIQAVKISDDATAVRTYTDNRKLIKASPQGRLSSLVNRWIVECEESTFTELLMAEELAAELYVSHRWNTGSKRYRVRYTHGDKIYRNPRLEILDSVNSIAFELAGKSSEELIDNSHDEADFALWDTFCTVKVETPDLTFALIAALAALAGSFFKGDIKPYWTQWTIRVGSALSAIATFAALNILAATCNVSYAVHGQPVARVRRTVRASADDLDGQVSLGQVIAEQPFKDGLCGSASDCQLVADFRKMVGMSERKRWTAEMVADLYVEDGDTISVIHPVSSQAITVFLTDMKIVYVKPSVEDNSGGGIFSTFEGWRL